MVSYDAWDVLALIACTLIVAAAVLAWALAWLKSHNPFTHTHRNTAGRRRMATDWKRPTYLPESWQ